MAFYTDDTAILFPRNEPVQMSKALINHLNKIEK